MRTIDGIKICRPAWETFFASAASLSSMHFRGERSIELERSVLSAGFDTLAAGLAEHRERGAALRRRTALGFTVFDFITTTENVLSDILVFLLDPSASHGQGSLFLRSLLGRVRPDVTVNCRSATIMREALTYSIPTHRRRIDILITLDDFVLAIENKQFTGEGWKQIEDYSQHLQNIAGPRPFCLIFLNRTGAEASSIAPAYASQLRAQRQLTSWSWEKDVPTWLGECLKHCEADKIRHFLDDLADYIRTHLVIWKEDSGHNENE